MVLGFILFLGIVVLYKLLIDGWLFKVPLFFGGWFGIYIWLNMTFVESHATAITLGVHNNVSWAALIPTIICILALACTKSD